MIRSYHMNTREVQTLSFEIRYAMKITKRYISDNAEPGHCNLQDALAIFFDAFREVHDAQNALLPGVVEELLIPEEYDYVKRMINEYIAQQLRKHHKKTKEVTCLANDRLFVNLGTMSKTDFRYALRRIYEQGNYFPASNIGLLPNSHREIYIKTHDAYMKKYNHPELMFNQ